MPVPGNVHVYDSINRLVDPNVQSELIHTAIVDESFQFVAAHVDENTRKRIISGEYIDFGLLLPRDRISKS